MPPARPELHRGRIAKTPKVLLVRPLTREDMACLTAKRVGPPKVKTLREVHHRVARLIASGLRDSQIASVTGYSPQRIYTLKTDPAIQELVAHYRDKVDQAWVESLDEFYETATSNMRRAERMIEEHLDAAEDSGELIPLQRLLPLISDRADRFGYGKHSTQTNEVKDFAKIMEAMAQKSGRSNVIDARVVSSPAALPAPPPVESQSQQELSLEASPPPTQVAAVGFRRR